MMNEILFLTHTFFVLLAAVAALLCGPAVAQALTCVYIVLANLFVVKKMLLFEFVASGSDMYIVGSMCLLMMGAQVWGSAFALRTARLSVAISLFFFVLCWFQLAYLPLPVDSMQSDFAILLGRMPHVTLFSIIAHFCAQMVTLALSQLFSVAVCQRWVIATTFFALVLGQIVDGCIFFGGAFGVSTTLPVLAQMVGISVAVKLIFMAASSFMVQGAVWLKERGYVS